MTHILLADADRASASLTTFVLSEAGYHVSTTANGQHALSQIMRKQIDMLLLEVHLPDINGFELCREARRRTKLPIMFVAGSGLLADRVYGLSSGADDYIAKPFEPAELLARVEAVLRRYRGSFRTQATISRGTMSLNPTKRLVTLQGGQGIMLTSIECQILQYLMSKAGRVVSDNELIEAVWGRDAKGRSLLTVYIYRLRKKLSPTQPNVAPLMTIRGQGYMFIEQAPPATCTR